MPCHGKFGRGFRQIQFVDVDVFIGSASSAFRKLVLKVLYFFFERGDFFLKRENWFPFDLEFFSIGVNLFKGESDLISKSLGSFLVVIIHQVLQNIFVKLGFLVSCEDHL